MRIGSRKSKRSDRHAGKTARPRVGAIRYLSENRFRRSDLKYFDWPLLVIAILISLFGIVTIFSATSSSVTVKPANIMEMLETQSIYYPRAQFLWLLVGIGAVCVIQLVPYHVFGRYASGLYVGNITVLVITLMFAKVGRGGMTAFLSVGNSSFQPSELGKSVMIICMAKVYSQRKYPIHTFRGLCAMGLYVGIPIVLVAAQPDFGTAMVYLAVFMVLTFVSGTDGKLLFRIVACILILAVPVLWYSLNNTSASDSFRMTRFLIWLYPDQYPDEARQVVNGQIALGSGGIFGKGIISPGSYASLGYISDDHTDFIFAIVCESFGLVGGCALVLAYAVMLARMIYQAIRIQDPFGSYTIMGVTGMFLFHIIENVGMVIGLTPVTGIPLPFVSYGGSNLLTNFIAIGVVENVIVRSRHEMNKLGDSRSVNRIEL